MKIVLAILTALMMTTSCDVEKRVARILGKYPEVVETYNDTIQVPVQIIDSITVERGDTSYTWYYVKDTIYQTIISRAVLDPSNVETRQEKRHKHKERKKEIRQDGKTDRTEVRQEGKTERKAIRGANWAFWITFILLLIVLGYLVVKRLLERS